MASDDAPLHVVVFPWLAFGHMIPYLELSKSLARRGHRVSYITTPRNLRRLPPVPTHLSHLIHFVPLPLPHSPGLPPDAEATSDLPAGHGPLKRSLDGLAGAVAAFLQSASPDWILFDLIQHWLPSLAASLGIPCAFYSIFPAAAFAFLGPPEALKASDGNADRLTAPPEWVPFPSVLACPRHEALAIHGFFTDNSSGATDSLRVARVIDGSRLVAFRSCDEVESQWLRLLTEVYRKPAVPVGIFPPAAQERGQHDETGDKVLDWLSEQKGKSVIYVALGTEAPLSVELIHELALGLELAGLPCIWALRRPPGLSTDVDILPAGFEERIASRGTLRVVVGWVPQLKILAHEAVGGFLTHCGWSSIIEGLGLGLPLVLLPVCLDQGINARVMAEKGVGVEVERGEDDGLFTREAVAKAVRLVMVEGEGERLRAKAKEMQKIYGDIDSHERYVDQFVQCLKDHKG